jgi:hypothetical protein
MKKDINITHNIIKPFLKNNFNKQYIYYKNPASIKIQLPKSLIKQVTEFLESQDINYVIEHPRFVVRNFRFIENMDTIRITFYKNK